MSITLIDSIYINNSGGKVLLDYLIKSIIKKKLSEKFYFLLDVRGDYDYLDSIDHYLGTNSEKFRKNFYKKNPNRFIKVFCFGNVPPPISLNVEVYTYFHNALLVKSIKGYPLKIKFFKYLKRLYIKKKTKNTNMFFVQSKSMKELISNSISPDVKTSIYPFYNLSTNSKYKTRKNKEFVYISNGNPHKNHLILLDTWEDLHKQDIKPKLNLTITKEYPSIIKRIEDMKNKGINIKNHGYTDVELLFESSSFLIYPSLIESFGLGLVEAVNAGLKVIASDLDYVHDVVKPSLTFDAHNKKSIIDAVKKVLRDDFHKDSKIIVENKIDELIAMLVSV